MTDINKLVKQFKIDIPRLHVGVSLPHLKMSITSCPSNEEGIIEWWLLHFSEKSSETLQKLLYQINTKKEIPFSFQRCLYWCTQTSLADYYTDFYYTHNMDESGHHLIDNNNSSSIYHVIFADDKHIYIKKSFRESYFNKNGNEVIVCYWTLYIKCKCNTW